SPAPLAQAIVRPSLDVSVRSEQSNADPSLVPEPSMILAPARPAASPAVQAAPSVPAPGTMGVRARFDWQRNAPHAVIVYLAGAMLMFVRLLLAICGGRRLKNRSHPVEDGVILAALTRQVRALHLRAAPAIAYCQAVCVPTVVGVLRPMILLPMSIASGMSPE